MLSSIKKKIFFDVVKTKMIVIPRHTIMNQWSWLQVFMMFQKISMLSYFIIMLTLHSLIFCATLVDLRHQLTVLKCKRVKCTVSTR